MIKLDADTLSVHRLVQTVARTPDDATRHDADPHRSSDVITTAHHRATALLRTTLPGEQETNVAGWPTWRTLLPHAEALLTATAPAHDTVDTAFLLTVVAIYLEGQGQIAQAIAYQRRSMNASICLHGPDHPSTLSSRNNLAYAYESAGDLGRAIPLYEQT